MSTLTAFVTYDIDAQNIDDDAYRALFTSPGPLANPDNHHRAHIQEFVAEELQHCHEQIEYTGVPAMYSPHFIVRGDGEYRDDPREIFTALASVGVQVTEQGFNSTAHAWRRLYIPGLPRAVSVTLTPQDIGVLLVDQAERIASDAQEAATTTDAQRLDTLVSSSDRLVQDIALANSHVSSDTLLRLACDTDPHVRAAALRAAACTDEVRAAAALNATKTTDNNTRGEA